MAEWSAAQVCEWVMQIDLPPGCAEPVCRTFAECEVEGDELAVTLAKPLLRVLAKGGVPEPEIVAEAILKQRDATLSRARDKKEAAPNECPFCFEIYTDDGDGSRVPRMLPCGHTGCHGCFHSVTPCEICFDPTIVALNVLS